jgi:hypothetical protein
MVASDRVPCVSTESFDLDWVLNELQEPSTPSSASLMDAVLAGQAGLPNGTGTTDAILAAPWARPGHYDAPLLAPQPCSESNQALTLCAPAALVPCGSTSGQYLSHGQESQVLQLLMHQHQLQLPQPPPQLQQQWQQPWLSGTCEPSPQHEQQVGHLQGRRLLNKRLLPA